MGRSSINLFPVLTEEMMSNSQYVHSIPSFSYYSSGKYYDLELRDAVESANSTTALLRDPLCKWIPDEFNLKYSEVFSFENIGLLFGKKGLVLEDSILGLAVTWIDIKSNQRGTIPVASFTSNQKNVNAIVDYVFPAGFLRGNLTLQTVLYVKHASTNRKTALANSPGIILGVLSETNLIIDGNGSIFPIVIHSDPKGLLWNVKYDYSCDPMTDCFEEENVCIQLNSGHPLFSNLNIETNMSETPLLVEILTTALLVICNSAKDQIGSSWDSMMDSGEGFDEGSIAQAMYYFKEKLHWDFSSQIALSDSIRNYFEKALQGKQL